MKRWLAILLVAFTAGSALAAGRPSLNAYFQSNLTDTAYQKKTFDRVAKAWKAPAAADLPTIGKKTVVQAVIAKDGMLSSAAVSMSSGRKGWDDAALKAVRAASPFDPLPAGYRHPSLEVHFHVAFVDANTK
ncbi:MAG: TonB C-terminal domain-containing protein [Thermoanaerobaculia bacterium]|nr:TonB C-terminal domain-containing protein [Thermoanaerobaculia bacterium]